MDHELLYDMIFKRKSFHLFRSGKGNKISPNKIDEIKEKYESLLPLYPEIKTAIKIVPSCETTCKRGQEYCILFYSEKKKNYLENIGYLGEQLDLYLVSQNIGTLWYGIGQAKQAEQEGLDFVIMMAIAQMDGPECFRKDLFKSKRKPIEEIWRGEMLDGVTEIVRFAPSACNTQPWLVEHEENQIRVYRYKKPGKRGIMPAAKVSYYNSIDIGIFLCFLELCYSHNHMGYNRTLYDDSISEKEKTLVAVYEK